MRILFVTATRIGDAILSTGLLSHLIDRYPHARITVASGPAAAPLFEAMPALERVIPLRKRRLSLHWLDLWQQCATRRWDLVIDLRRSAISWFLLSRERRVAPPTNLEIHRVPHLAATLSLQSMPPNPICWTRPQDEAQAAELVPEGGPVLAVAAAANWPGKQWRPEYFVELIERLTRPDGPLPEARVAVIAAAQEGKQVQPLLDAFPADRLLKPHRNDPTGGCRGATPLRALRRQRFRPNAHVGSDGYPDALACSAPAARSTTHRGANLQQPSVL